MTGVYTKQWFAWMSSITAGATPAVWAKPDHWDTALGGDDGREVATDHPLDHVLVQRALAFVTRSIIGTDPTLVKAGCEIRLIVSC